MFGRREFLVGSLAVAGGQAAKCASSLPQLGARKSISTVGELEQACRTGGTFALRPGIYVLGDKVLRPVSGTHLSGTPGRTILRKSTSPGPYRTRAFFDIQDAKDVTLLGLVFDHRAARTEHAIIVRATSPGASSRIKLLNNVYRQCHVQLERFVEQVTIRDGQFLGDGVALTGVSTGGEIDKVSGKFVGRDGAVRNLLLDKLYFERTVSEAIDLNWHTQGVRATNIRCYNCDTGGVDEIIDIGGDVRTTEANQCRDIRFSNVSIVNDLPGATKTVAVQVKGRSRNVFFSNLKISRRGETGAGSAGVRVWNSDDTEFDGLVIDGSAFGILSTARGQRVPKRLRLANVHVRNYDGEAIQLEGDDVVLQGFDVDGTGSAPQVVDLLALTNSVIRNGTVQTAGAAGVRVQPSCSNVLIDNVAIRGSPSGRKFVVRGRQIRLRAVR